MWRWAADANATARQRSSVLRTRCIADGDAIHNAGSDSLIVLVRPLEFGVILTARRRIAIVHHERSVDAMTHGRARETTRERKMDTTTLLVIVLVVLLLGGGGFFYRRRV
jgi:hypothetical protein